MGIVDKTKSIFNSSLGFTIISIFTTALIITGFVLKIYFNHYNKTIYQLESESAKIERSFVNILDLTAEIMRMVSSQIVPNYEDQEYIKNILFKYKSNPNISDVLSWTVFSWVNHKNMVTTDSMTGILKDPIDASERDYLEKAFITPNQFILGDPITEKSSSGAVIPAAMGATNLNGEYVGAINIGFNIDKLSNKLSDYIKNVGAEFLIVDHNLDVVVAHANSRFKAKNAKSLISRNEDFKTTGKIHSKAEDLIKGNNYYITKLHKYPYTLCVYFDRSIIIQSLWEEIASRIIEISIIAIAAFTLIICIYRRESFLRKQAESSREVAIMASKAKSDFLAYIAHELRTPLGFIVTGSAIVKNQLFGELPEKYAEYIKNINQSAIELSELIDDILDETSTERGNFTIHNTLLDLNNLFSDLLKKNTLRAKKSSIEIATEIEENLPNLVSDARRLSQILNNLISNSIKYSPPKTKITLSCYMKDNNLIISVADQGFGISEKEMEIAFSEYGTIKNKNSGKVESLGLGLPLVKMLTTELGAQIKVESEKEVGTKITVIFPSSFIIRKDT